jgi:hypothetical protein
MRSTRFSLVSREKQDVLHELIDVPAGRPGLGHALGRSALELLRRAPKLDAIHQRLNGSQYLAPLELAVELDADPPHVLDVPRVPHLITEAWAAQHGHAGAHALQRGVPPAVRPEPSHRRVRQDLLLWRPAHDLSPAACGRVESIGQGRRRVVVTGDEARPEHPEERAAAIGDAPGRLDEVGG